MKVTGTAGVQPTTRATTARARATMTSMKMALMLALTLSCSLSGVRGDWIDPDTPMDQRLTQPYPDRVLDWHDKKASAETSAPSAPQKPKSTNLPSVSPSSTPSAAPSNSNVPSSEPSSQPTEYPTATPGSYELIFSDEFNTPGRTFEDGADPRWTALEKNDYTNDALHYYSNRNAETNDNGELVITTEAEDTEIVGFDDVKQEKVHDTKHFRSAMIQTWNKFCFTGGIVEIKATMPGSPTAGGLWPAFWLLGNLARHTYVGSSEHVWPWSSSRCTQQSFESQLISGCAEAEHFGLHSFQGRGSPEIDIYEVQPGDIKANQGPFLESPVGQPFMSASFQAAPGMSSNRPGNGWWPGPNQWYDGLKGGYQSALNIQFYGNYNHFSKDQSLKKDYWSDAISYNRQLAETHFNSSHVYRLEWDVPTDEKDGYLHWFLDGELVLSINGTGIRESGMGAEISAEPSYLLINTAISSQWGFPKDCPTNCDCKKYDCNSKEWQHTCGFSRGFCKMLKAKPKYKVDWIRIYQDPSKPEQKVGCSTPERPTRRYIEAHQENYMTENDEQPLKEVQNGGGECVVGFKPDGKHPAVRQNCGGKDRGTCTKKKTCACNEGWTGAYCLAKIGTNPVDWDPPTTLADVGFEAPDLESSTHLLVGFGVLFVGLVGVIWHRASNKNQEYTVIPNIATQGTLA